MKILNKTVGRRFTSFYEEMVLQIGETRFYQSHIPGLAYYRHNQGINEIRLHADVNQPCFEHQIAHELIHALQRKEGWPRLVSRHFAELGETLVSMVLDLNVEDRLKSWAFESAWIINDQYRNIRRAILHEDTPATGTNRWRRGAMMYTYALLTQPTKRQNILMTLFQQRAPHIARKSEELVCILKDNGWSNPDEALSSLIAIRSSIGLQSSQLGIIDGRTEQRF